MRRIVCFITIFLTALVEGFARTGGGSGSGGGLRQGLTIIFAISFFILLAYRTRQSKKQIEASKQSDSLWNYDRMIQYVETVFMRMQDAWTKKDLLFVNDIITQNLNTDFGKKINHLNFINETHCLEDIKIKSIKIIGCEDHIDNEQDAFSAYIHGSMADYSVSGLTDHITTNFRKNNENFSDLYYFKKHIDNWLPDKVENSVEITDLFKVKYVTEKIFINT